MKNFTIKRYEKEMDEVYQRVFNRTILKENLCKERVLQKLIYCEVLYAERRCTV